MYYYEREGRYRIIDAYHCVVAQELLNVDGEGPRDFIQNF
jgi:hypothetical protein